MTESIETNEQLALKLRQTEHLLRESEDRWRNFLSYNMAGIWRFEYSKPMPLSLPFDQQIEWMMDRGVLIEANSAALKLHGFSTADDLVGKTYREIYSYDENVGRELLRAWIKQGYSFDGYESRSLTNSGEYRWFLVFCHPVIENGHIVGSWGSEFDITDRKLAEDALRESERRYRTLFNSANDAILIVKDNKFIECNQKTLEMFACSREQIIGRTPYYFSPKHQPDGRDSTEKALDKFATVIDGQPHVFEWRHLRLNGEAFDAEVSLSSIGIESETFIQAIVRDISGRKKLDKELQLMKRWVEHSIDLFFWVREDSRLLYVNQAVCRSLGYTKQELRSMKVSDFDLGLPPEAWSGFAQRLREEGSHCFETRLRKKNGQIIHVEITANTLVFDKKIRIFAYGRDISARVSADEKQRELQNQLRQAQKMEAIGTLAGGIAHDFNNILSSIIGFTEISMRDAPPGSKLQENLQKVFNSGVRAAELVKQILTFSRQTEHEVKPVRVKPIAEETLKLIRASLPATIEIHQDLRSDSPILADPTQIHQVIMNLCTNAHHAMRDAGGKLVVSLNDVELNADVTGPYPDMAPGPYVKLTVNDNGHGIAPEIKDRIFDPFYTTKQLDEGTGLGLSVVHGIVLDCGGMLSVDSTPGEGSTFDIFFPMIESGQDAEIVNRGALPTGNERILLVDDEKSHVEMCKQVLEHLGYQVTANTSSRDALNVFRARPDDFDLVVTDLTMPKMTGDFLAYEIKSIRSDMPVILCTGYAGNITPAKTKALGIKEVVMKPAVAEELAGSVRRALDHAND